MDPNQLPKIAPAVPAPVVPKPNGGQVSLGHPEAEHFAAKKVERVQQQETKVQTVEASNNLELSKEILPGVEEKHHASEPIVLPSQIDLSGLSSAQVPIESMTFKPEPLVLPLNEDEMNSGLHKSVWDSFRWLAEWCVKQLKEAHLKFKRQSVQAK